MLRVFNLYEGGVFVGNLERGGGVTNIDATPSYSYTPYQNNNSLVIRLAPETQDASPLDT